MYLFFKANKLEKFKVNKIKIEYYAMNFLNENYRLGFMMPEQMI